MKAMLHGLIVPTVFAPYNLQMRVPPSLPKGPLHLGTGHPTELQT